MKFEMPWWGKAVITCFLIFSSVAGGMYTSLLVFQGDIKAAKVEAMAYADKGDKDIKEIMDIRKVARDEELKLRDEKHQAQLAAISDKITDLKLFIGRKFDQKITVLRPDEDKVTFKSEEVHVPYRSEKL